MKIVKLISVILVLLMIISAVMACDDKTQDPTTTDSSTSDSSNDTGEGSSGEGSSGEKFNNIIGDEDLPPVSDVALDAPRVLLVTDFHYTDDRQGIYYGVNKDVRMASMVNAINEEHAKDPLEAVFFLGDSSLDHWKWQVGGSWITYGVSYTRTFLDKYRTQFASGLPLYFLPGNHEQFSNEQWKTITGNERNFSVVINDYLFICWDSYGANLDPSGHHDGEYTALNVIWANQCIANNPGKKVLMISHSVKTSDGTTGDFVRNNNVKAMFVGHDHSAHMTSAFGKSVLHCGNYSYYNDSSAEDAKTYMWGFRDLYLFGDKLYSRYIVPDNTANPSGTTVTVQYHYQNVYEVEV